MEAVTVNYTELIKPLVDTVKQGVIDLAPAGITIMGVMVSLSLIPRIFYKFF